MEERKCELRLPNGKVVNFSYAKLKAGIAVTALVLVGAVGGAAIYIISWRIIAAKQPIMLL